MEENFISCRDGVCFLQTPDQGSTDPCQDQDDNKRKTCLRILEALTQSSIIDELQHYKTTISEDLHLSDEDLKLFDLRKIIDVLTPQPERHRRFYKGREIREQFSESRPTETFLGELNNIGGLGENLLDECLNTHHTIINNPELLDEVSQNPQTSEVAPKGEKGNKRVISVISNEKGISAEPANSNDNSDNNNIDNAIDTNVGVDGNQDSNVQYLVTELNRRGVSARDLKFDTKSYTTAFVVSGATKAQKRAFFELGGRWSHKLKGWIFDKHDVQSPRTEQTEPEQSESE
jgi:hypothetical protein